MRKISLFVLVLLLFCVTPLWALDTATDLVNRSSYPPEDKAYLLEKVTQIFEEAQGLPQELLVKKLKEGLVKRVTPDNIVLALEQRKESLRKAQYLLEEAGVQERKSLLEDLALSLELSVPPEVLAEVLKRASNNPKVAERFVDTLATLLEVGVSSEKAEEVLRQVAEKDLGVKELRKVAGLLEQAQREGVEVQKVADVLSNALRRYNNFNLVEIEIQGFIAANKPKPALRSGQGVVPQPGISSSGTPVEEGGTPLEPQPSAPRPPTQEGGEPLE
ncbi:MAG: hypothetical protein ACUVTO_03270 [Candidatus Caldatribacteriaceae bacterium]